MPSITFIDAVTHIPADWANDVNTLVYDVFGGAQTVLDATNALGLGNMAIQSADNVTILGGILRTTQVPTLDDDVANNCTWTP